MITSRRDSTIESPLTYHLYKGYHWRQHWRIQTIFTTRLNKIEVYVRNNSSSHFCIKECLSSILLSIYKQKFTHNTTQHNLYQIRAYLIINRTFLDNFTQFHAQLVEESKKELLCTERQVKRVDLTKSREFVSLIEFVLAMKRRILYKVVIIIAACFANI